MDRLGYRPPCMPEPVHTPNYRPQVPRSEAPWAPRFGAPAHLRPQYGPPTRQPPHYNGTNNSVGSTIYLLAWRLSGLVLRPAVRTDPAKQCFHIMLKSTAPLTRNHLVQWRWTTGIPGSNRTIIRLVITGTLSCFMQVCTRCHLTRQWRLHRTPLGLVTIPAHLHRQWNSTFPCAVFIGAPHGPII